MTIIFNMTTGRGYNFLNDDELEQFLCENGHAESYKYFTATTYGGELVDDTENTLDWWETRRQELVEMGYEVAE